MLWSYESTEYAPSFVSNMWVADGDVATQSRMSRRHASKCCTIDYQRWCDGWPPNVVTMTTTCVAGIATSRRATPILRAGWRLDGGWGGYVNAVKWDMLGPLFHCSRTWCDNKGEDRATTWEGDTYFAHRSLNSNLPHTCPLVTVGPMQLLRLNSWTFPQIHDFLEYRNRF